MGKSWNWSTSIWKFVIHWKIVHPGQVTFPSQSGDKQAWAGLPSSAVHFTTTRYSLIQRVFPCVVSRMDANSCVTCQWNNIHSRAVQCTKGVYDQSRGTKSEVIRMDQRKLKLLCIKSLLTLLQVTADGYNADSSCRRRRADRNTRRTCANRVPGRWFWSGFFSPWAVECPHEDMSFRDISLLHVGSNEIPTSVQPQKSETGVELQTSVPISKSVSLIELTENTPGCWG